MAAAAIACLAVVPGAGAHGTLNVKGKTAVAGKSGTLTWLATGGGLPNAEVGDFAITVSWPKKAGTFNTPTAQYCGTQLMDWKDPFNAAADGDRSYPATCPVPRVRVRTSAARTPSAVAR